MAYCDKRKAQTRRAWQRLRDAISRHQLKIKGHPVEWFLKPLSVAITAGLILLVISNCYKKENKGIELPNELREIKGKESLEETSVYYSWSYQRIGDIYEGFLIFRRGRPWYSIQFKVALIGDSTETIDVCIPINGKVMDYDFPANLDFEVTDTRGHSKEKIESSFNVVLRNISPRQIVHFTLSVRHEMDTSPFDMDGVSVYKGKAEPIKWENFQGQLERKEKGFWKTLF